MPLVLIARNGWPNAGAIQPIDVDRTKFLRRLLLLLLVAVPQAPSVSQSIAVFGQEIKRPPHYPHLSVGLERLKVLPRCLPSSANDDGHRAVMDGNVIARAAAASLSSSPAAAAAAAYVVQQEVAEINAGGSSNGDATK